MHTSGEAHPAWVRGGAALLLGVLVATGFTGCGSEDAVNASESSAAPTAAASNGATDDTATADLPVPNPEPDNEAVNAALQGLTETAANEKAAAAGYTVRVASVDGEPRALTMDFRYDRINLELDDGQVTRAFVG